MLRLASTGSSDVFYDLGCGDASLLIFATREFHLKEAIGFENNPARQAIARRHVRREGLSDRISIEDNMYDADLGAADVILSMLPEVEEDYSKLLKSGIRDGTRVIKHDLPLLGFDYDAIDYPFYLTRFPLRKMETSTQWASRVMERTVSSVVELWHELFYYGYEKGYDKWDIRRFDRILRSRLRS